MSESEGFDPLKIRAEERDAKEKSKHKKKILHRLMLILLLPVLLIGGAYAVGGIGSASEWRSIRRDLSALHNGDATPDQVSAMVSSALKIEDRRGNHAALAGVYSVYALEMMHQGNFKLAGQALAVLNHKFADETFFSGLWQKKNLTGPCEKCGGKPKFVTCKVCRGKGWLPAVGGKLKGDKGKGRRQCPVCHGKGRIRSSDPCEKCGGSGSVILQDAVTRNRDKALRRTLLLVRLKCIQNFLGLHF